MDCVGARLLPELEGRGFAQIALSAKEAHSEIAVAFPFGRFRRLGANGYELIEIQFDKRRRAAFRLNVGRVPREGVEHELGGRLAAEDVWVQYLDRLYNDGNRLTVRPSP